MLTYKDCAILKQVQDDVYNRNEKLAVNYAIPNKFRTIDRGKNIYDRRI